MKIAAIDIGSNALRLLIKDCSQPDFMQSLETLHSGDYYERIPLKSGMDVFAEGQILPPTKIKLTLALQRFAQIMRQHGVSRYRAVATSSYRDALNGQQVIDAVSQTCRLNVEIISGEEEARLTRLSFQPPAQWADDYFVFVDVGGGSTEVSVMHKGQMLYGHSFQVGSMRYLCNTQEAAQEQALDSTIAAIHATHSPLHYIATGGCVKFMCKYLQPQSRKAAESQSMGAIIVSQMQAVHDDLLTKTVPQIVADYNLPEERADILTPAAGIFLRIARGLEAEEIAVPSIGVRNGIIAELFMQSAHKEQDQHEEHN